MIFKFMEKRKKESHAPYLVWAWFPVYTEDHYFVWFQYVYRVDELALGGWTTYYIKNL